MRSVAKLLGFVFMALAIPVLVMSLVRLFTNNQIVLIMSQFVIMILMVLAFTKIFDIGRRYEKKTSDLIKKAKNIDELKKLREERLSYRSKASITSEILMKEFSEEEAENLRRYTNTTEDMRHYYSAYISNSMGDEREAYKIKRDNFNKKYKNKLRIYPDFEENLKQALKWVGLFFLLAFIFSMVKTYFNPGINLAFLTYVVGLVVLLSFMINGIVWIVRTVKSYWDKKFL